MVLSDEKSQSPKILGKRQLTADNNGSGRIRKNCRIDAVRTYPLCFGPDQGIAGDNAGIDVGDNVHSQVSSISSNQNDRAEVSKGWEFDWVEVDRTEVEVIEISDEETEVDESDDSIDAQAAGDIATPVKVWQVLNIYRGLCASLSLDDEDVFSEPRRKQVYVKAAMILKNENRWLNCERAIGNVPGVNAGDEFQFRAELVVVGLHHEFQSTISYATMGDTDYAVSVVHSGPSVINGVLVFSAQGGISKVSKASKGRMHQKGNLALKNSMDSNIPVRVISKVEVQGKQVSYVYDGLYNVVRFWPERSSKGKMELKFEMARLGGERFKTRTHTHDHVISEDLSEGIEKFPIKAVNDLNDEKPQPFTYISEMIVTGDREIPTPIGCDCEDGCSDSHQCACVKKNRGEIPFNEDGAIVKAKKRIHECGPNCRCPPSCQNRVSQHGLKLPLEVFRTKSTGWGVRSRQEIPSGAFICEYLGELMEDLEADERTNDEYLLDLDDGTGFTIDAAKYGNVSRFINHSCSPNVYAQNVLYDHEDKKVPHVMFFATKTIPAMEELSYHYDYKIDGVRDANGNIKKKKCFCGARCCKGRLY